MKGEKKQQPEPTLLAAPGSLTRVTRWEYKQLTASSAKTLLELANVEGGECWELVSAIQARNADVPTLFFKRPLP